MQAYIRRLKLDGFVLVAANMPFAQQSATSNALTLKRRFPLEAVIFY